MNSNSYDYMVQHHLPLAGNCCGYYCYKVLKSERSGGRCRRQQACAPGGCRRWDSWLPSSASTVLSILVAMDKSIFCCLSSCICKMDGRIAPAHGPAGPKQEDYRASEQSCTWKALSDEGRGVPLGLLRRVSITPITRSRSV